MAFESFSSGFSSIRVMSLVFLRKSAVFRSVWGLAGPAYKALEFHRTPGQTGTLNSHWLLEREAVADERSGSFDAGTLGYSSSGRGHWPLTAARSLSGMLNFYWPSTHLGSLGRLSGALNSHWLSGGSSFSSFSGTSWDVAW